jgi:hypothetical protein
MTTRARLTATLDRLSRMCSGDRMAMQAMLTAEIERNPCGPFASALKLLDIVPTIEALEAARDRSAQADDLGSTIDDEVDRQAREMKP